MAASQADAADSLLVCVAGLPGVFFGGGACHAARVLPRTRRLCADGRGRSRTAACLAYRACVIIIHNHREGCLGATSSSEHTPLRGAIVGEGIVRVGGAFP